MKKLLSILCGLVIVLTGCSGNNDTFVFSVDKPVETMDPINASYKQTYILFSDIFVGLQRVDDSAKLINAGAKSIEVSDDKLVYTIKLRDDMKWVDNTGAEMANVTANDYVTSFKRMVDPDEASVYSYIYEPIKNATAISSGDKKVDDLGVKAIDDNTLQITLEQVTPYFQSMLSFESFVPVASEAVEKYGDEYGTSAETTWYNGPYYVTSYDPNYIISLSKNELYPNADKVEVPKIDFRLNEDSSSRYNAFNSGEIDYAEIDSVEDYAAAKEEGKIEDHLTAYSMYAVLNSNENSVASNSNLRKALSYGFDRSTIAKTAFGDINKPIEYLIPKDMTPVAYDGVEYRDYADDSLIKYDKDKADKYFDAYMKEMGYTSRDQIHLKYLASADANGGNKVAEGVQAFYLQEFGISIDLDIQPFQQFTESRRVGAFDMLVTGWGPDYADPSTYLGIWVTSQIGSQNPSGYSNKEYDELYAKANKEQDLDKRFSEFAKLEQKLVDDGAVIPFYQKNYPYLVSEGYEVPLDLMFNISHEYLKANQS